MPTVIQTLVDQLEIVFVGGNTGKAVLMNLAGNIVSHCVAVHMWQSAGAVSVSVFKMGLETLQYIHTPISIYLCD